MNEIYWKDIKSADIVINLPKTFEVLNTEGENFRVYWAEDERYRAATYLVRKAKRDLPRVEVAAKLKAQNAQPLVIITNGEPAQIPPGYVELVAAARPATDPDDEEDPGDDIENFPTAEKAAAAEVLAKDFH